MTGSKSVGGAFVSSWLLLLATLTGCAGASGVDLSEPCTPPEFAGYHMVARSGACGEKTFNPAFDQGYLATIIGDDSAEVSLSNGRCTTRLDSRNTWLVVNMNTDWSRGEGEYQEDNCHYSVTLVRE